MQIIRSMIVAAATAAALAAGPAAHGDDGEDGPSYDDLIAYRGGGIHWWFVHRGTILRPSYRAGSTTAGVVAPPDAPARGRARDALLAALESQSDLVRSEAALALGRLGDARDVATLAAIVDDRDNASFRRTHRMAALGLGLLPAGDAAQSARARTSLLAALDDARGKHDQFAYFWANCAYALAMRGDAAALPKLLDVRRKGLAAVDMQSSIHTDVLGAMCYAIAALGGESVLPEIEEHLRGEKAPDGGSKDSAWAACQALVRVGGDAGKRDLLKAARDDRDDVRRAALAALGAFTDPKDAETAALLRSEALEGKKGWCRGTAAVSLGRTGHATAGPTLIEMLDTAQPDVRPSAALGLGLLGRIAPDRSVTDALGRAIAESSTNEGLTSALCLACGLAGVESARPRLVEFAGSSKASSVTAYAAFSLGLLGPGAEERRVLHDLVAKPGSFTARREAALALGMAHDRTVVEQLRGLLSDKAETDVNLAAAAICLGRVGDDSDIDFLLGVLARSRAAEQLRACVLNGLGRLLDRSEDSGLARLVADSMTFRLVRSGQPDSIYDIQHLVD